MIPVSQSLFAQEYIAVKDIEQVKKKLKATSATIKSIAADFTQEKHLSILQEPTVSNGKFYYKAENKVRWQIITPEPYMVIINGTDMTVVENSKNKKYDTRTNKMYGKIYEVMMGSIKGTLGDDTKKYRQEYFESSTHIMMKLFPLEKMAKKYLEQIQVLFDKKDYDVSSIKMMEPGDDFTEIRFFNKILNGQLDDGLFITR